ncbi:Gfo/Idh/MocA family protein [Williamsoniiplasma luminosum]|uniref:Uncharacterized protein n=1 Tax=Williamsoniiplasma luminosum TaxID=214888 RepID=A0A2S0NL94_9MOLU|nr:Gfo/Idh/MocA family oxidoreductase [Williamsoniiplasma luminosum]AVP49772.1 MAG: hypothetical protein C5T88_04360 [Williamsoniiplasma luminosum]
MIKIGTIGTSYIADMFIHAVKQIENIEVTAVSSRKEQTARQLIERANLSSDTKIVEDWKELIAFVDCVYIGTPNGTHYEIAKYLLENNKHVFVEKTATFKVQEFEELMKIAQTKNLILMEAFKPIHYPQYQLLKDFKNQYDIVTVNLTQSSYSRFMPELKSGQNPSSFEPNLGRGTTYDMLVYPVQFAIDLLGDIKHVKSMKRKLPNGVSIINNVLLEHENGILTTINNSKMSFSGIDNELATEDRVNLIFDNPNGLKKIAICKWDQKYKSTVEEIFTNDKSINGMIYETQVFVDLIQNNDFAQRDKFLELTKKTIKVLESIDNEIDY